jgi:hypothetical protein
MLLFGMVVVECRVSSVGTVSFIHGRFGRRKRKANGRTLQIAGVDFFLVLPVYTLQIRKAVRHRASGRSPKITVAALMGNQVPTLQRCWPGRCSAVDKLHRPKPRPLRLLSIFHILTALFSTSPVRHLLKGKYGQWFQTWTTVFHIDSLYVCQKRRGLTTRDAMQSPDTE